MEKNINYSKNFSAYILEALDFREMLSIILQNIFLLKIKYIY